MMNELLLALGRSNPDCLTSARMRQADHLLTPTQHLALKLVCQHFDAPSSQVLVVACATLLLRYTQLPVLQFQWESEGCITQQSLQLLSHTIFSQLLDSLNQPTTEQIPMLQLACHTEDGPCTGALPTADNIGDAMLRIECIAHPETLRVLLRWREDVLMEAMAQRFSYHLGQLLCSLATQPALELVAHRYLGPEELRQLLDFGCGPQRDYVPQTVLALIAQHAQRQPYALALEDAKRRISYSELMQRSALLAQGLLARGLAPRSRVGVLLDRSVDWIVALLGILRADMVYVPLSVRNPPARNDYILADCAAACVLTDASAQQALAHPQLWQLKDIWHSAGSAALPTVGYASDAYVIYTSGSTGQPKGVRITHGALSNYIQASKEAFGLDMTVPRNMQFAEASFDFSIFEIFYSLCHGGSTLIYARSEVLSMTDVCTTIEQHQINLVSPATSLWHAWRDQLDAGQCQMPTTVQVVVVGGEAAIADKFHTTGLPSQLRLVNAYGPTEATVFATAFRSTSLRQTARHVPIGRPFPNARLYILDAQLHAVPIGVVGEICIAGIGVSPGYIGRDDLNTDRFATLTDGVPGERIYRTGDQGFFLPDGQLVCLGRGDAQIKISGMRIDLSEIETRLNACEWISRAVVGWDVQLGLSMWIKPAQGIACDARTLDRIYAYLAVHLPTYMLPRHNLFVTDFPLNTSGKIDRLRLPLPHLVAATTLQTTHPIEQILWQLWQKTVPAQNLASVYENLLDKQVSSLKLGLFFAEVAMHWDVDLDLEQLTTISSIASLAQWLNAVLKPEMAA